MRSFPWHPYRSKDFAFIWKKVLFFFCLWPKTETNPTALYQRTPQQSQQNRGSAPTVSPAEKKSSQLQCQNNTLLNTHTHTLAHTNRRLLHGVARSGVLVWPLTLEAHHAALHGLLVCRLVREPRYDHSDPESMFDDSTQSLPVPGHLIIPIRMNGASSVLFFVWICFFFLEEKPCFITLPSLLAAPPCCVFGLCWFWFCMHVLNLFCHFQIKPTNTRNICFLADDC